LNAKKTEENYKLNEPIKKEFNRPNEFNEYEVVLLDLHNKERKNKKIKEFKLDKNLCSYAQKHAENMANKNSMYHSKMNDLMEFNKGSLVGENVAWNQKTEQEVVFSWILSPMHRYNILSKKYKTVGFGKASKNGSIYWCAVFSDKEVE